MFMLIKNLKNEASKRHIDPNRLIFAKRMPSIADHLSRHRIADLFIDTFPYGAHSTCADALWAGVPVITLAGESFASKVSASLLNAIGLSELITNTEKEYEDLAVELATNPARLKEIRKKLENYRITKPLFNTKLFVKNIESAYSAIHERYFLNKKPENIKIK